MVLILTLPETLFSRKDANELEHRNYLKAMFGTGKILRRTLMPLDFVRPFLMLKFICVIVPAL